MFLRWLQRRDSTGLVGLDISPEFIKLLKINTQNTPYQLEQVVVTPVAKGLITKDEIKEVGAVAALLKDIFSQHDIQSKDVALAVPRSSIIIKNINIDKRLSESEIESRAWFEAYQHFPDLVGEIYLDFRVIGPAQDANQVELMLIACRKERIKPYLELCKQAGITPKIIDVNSYALERALNIVANDLPNIETVALLNLDFALSSLIVIQKGELIFSHDHPFDGMPLKTKIDEYLTNKKLQGKEYIGSMQEEDEYMSLLQEKLGAHLRHTMHFFYSSRPQVAIQHVVLSGECSNIFNLPMFIHREIGVDTVLADPFTRMVLSSKVDKDQLQKQASMLMLACGLALSQYSPM